MKTITINVKDTVVENILYLLKNLSDIEIVETKELHQDDDKAWSYWKDEELDNFGKISIGLSKHDYDDEDYSKW